MKTIFLALTIISTFLNLNISIAAPLPLTETQQLDERITELELKNINEKINWGMDLKIDSAVMNDRATSATGVNTSNSVFINSVIFRLNADSKLADKLSLFATAESFSFFNQNLFNTASAIGQNREVQSKGQNLSVTRAYFDWRIHRDWLTFSAGRLPTTQGPPLHIKEGTPRQGTYPITAYSVPLDGFALTAKLSTPFEMKDNLSLRFIFKPGGPVNEGYPFRGFSAGDNLHPNRVTKNSEFFSTMLEYEQDKNEHGYWDKMLAIMQFGLYKISSPQPYQTSGLVITGVAEASDIAKIFFDRDKLLDAKILSPYIEFNKLFKTNFDFYATLTVAQIDSYAKAYLKMLTGNNTTGNFGNGANGTLELGSFLAPGKSTSTKLITGTRYEFTNKTFLGFEYMKSNEKTVPTVFFSNSALNPNYYNGHAFEVYSLKSMYNDHFIVKLGYNYINANSDLSSGFKFENIVEKIHVVQATFNIKI